MGKKKGKKDTNGNTDFDFNKALESLKEVSIGAAASGTTIETREGLGRVLVATKVFKTGDIVLQESPFCVFENSWIGLALEYSKMTAAEKEKLMEFQHISSVEEARHPEFILNTLATFTELLCLPEVRQLMETKGIDENDAFKLCTIVAINAHMYIGHTSYEVSTSITPHRGALFYIASKMSHSCNPNCCYTSKQIHGELVYFATRPILCGDLLTFSYIESTYSPTSQRRADLMRSKDFFCLCEKCCAPDWAESYPCAMGACREGITCPTVMAANTPSEWSCILCRSATSPSTERSDKAYAWFKAVEKMLVTPTLHEEVSQVIGQIKPFISPVNHKLIEMYIWLSSIYATDAHCWKKFGNQNKWLQSVISSTSALLRAIAMIECLDSKCTAGANCTIEHPPLHSLCHFVLWVCMDFIETRRAIPKQVQKYLMFLEMIYGCDDEDICKIKLACNHKSKR